jgi:DNA gyrase subunit A
MACRFDESQVRSMGRTARGVKGITFKLENDVIVSMEVVKEIIAGEESDEVAEEDAEELEAVANGDTEAGEENIEGTGPELLVISSGGIGKRSFVSTYRKTKRAAKGVRNIRLLDNQQVVAAIQVTSGDEIMLTTEAGQMVRFLVDEIRRVGRNSKGVKIMNLRKGDSITGAVKIVKVKVEDDENAEAAEAVDENVQTLENDITDSNEASVTNETEQDGGNE